MKDNRYTETAMLQEESLDGVGELRHAAGVLSWSGIARTGDLAETATRLARYLRTDPRFWLNLQAAYNISKAPTTATI